jgi:hypothetical protein
VDIHSAEIVGSAYFPKPRSAAMTKDISKPEATENLVKTSPEASVELSEKELTQVAGGQKNKTEQQKYLEIKLTDVLISSY